MPDKYRNFAELQRSERAGADYSIACNRRNSAIAVIAPHGGHIEPGSSEIAAAIAGDDFNLYIFSGLRRRPHGDLHVTSASFDEPNCLAMVAACKAVIAVHGLRGKDELVDIGGLDAKLRNDVQVKLAGAGFNAQVVTTGGHAAVSPLNICNRSQTGAGVQLELSRGLRDVLLNDAKKMKAFSDAIRSAAIEA